MPAIIDAEEMNSVPRESASLEVVRVMPSAETDLFAGEAGAYQKLKIAEGKGRAQRVKSA